MKKININLIVDGKNKKSFLVYLSKHPKERLWQAILNWSKKYQKIYGEYHDSSVDHDVLEDTFYLSS